MGDLERDKFKCTYHIYDSSGTVAGKGFCVKCGYFRGEQADKQQSNAQSSREKLIMDLVTEAFHACRSHQSYQTKPDYHVARAEKALERILEVLQRAGIDV